MPAFSHLTPIATVCLALAGACACGGAAAQSFTQPLLEKRPGKG
jgi:hypothetical protein